MTGYIGVKGFEKFQHYKDRNPPWIKLYNDLLDNYEFGQLADDTKFHLVAIWLLASRYNNQIPADAAWIGKRINATNAVNISALITAGFLVPDQACSKTLALRKQNAMPETETETVINKRGLQEPNDEHRALAQSLGLNCKDQFQRYRDWQASTGKAHKDEVAGFRNWLKNAKGIGPAKPLRIVTGDWWRSEGGVEQRARELGLWPARPGESTEQFIARLHAAGRVVA